MMELTFESAGHIVRVRHSTIADLEIASELTNNEFVSMAKTLGEEKYQTLIGHLRNIYFDYIVKEFREMGYRLVEVG